MIGLVEFAHRELGITLTPGQHEMLDSFDRGNYSQAAWQCGRRGGKSLLADIIALADVALRDDLRTLMRPGELRVASISGPRSEQANAHIRRSLELIDHSPRLRAMLVSETSDELLFSNGSAIRAYPCSARGIRGDAWSSAILDEFGHFVSTEDGPAASDRILEAALPALAQFGKNGWLIAVSTPLWRQGAFAKMIDRAQSGRFEHLHYRHLSTAEMNPRIPAEWLDERRREDPELYSREFEANFVDAGQFIDPADVTACVERDRHILPPRDGVRYVAALDPAYSQDNFALSIGHKQADGRIAIDGVWIWRRHGHDATLDEVASLLHAYRVERARTDQFCAVPVLEGLQQRGLRCKYEPWSVETKASAFTALRVALGGRNVSLPDDRALVEELCSLEARPTPSGMMRICAARGGHDDRAVVVAAIVHTLVHRGQGAAFIEVWEQLAATQGRIVVVPERAQPVSMGSNAMVPSERLPAGQCPDCRGYGETVAYVGAQRMARKLPCLLCRPAERAAALRAFEAA